MPLFKVYVNVVQTDTYIVLADDEEHARVRLEEGYGTLDDEQVHNSEIDHVEVF